MSDNWRYAVRHVFILHLTRKNDVPGRECPQGPRPGSGSTHACDTLHAAVFTPLSSWTMTSPVGCRLGSGPRSCCRSRVFRGPGMCLDINPPTNRPEVRSEERRVGKDGEYGVVA